ncbi:MULTISPECIES: 3-deoxy-manno-octulosonate-8-phosphatase KdsC [unclassified Shewanella]|jgi:3-deoxy-D-manno-octulosonate 8-phosphate phosphatase (KDO 8-P phosphatase)|uniref:3-deoxy-manno-octulosonate-8-phosphatase KdsC n=1 Tax=unclassified Shewanella TaxID=196818 RepID=UPI001A97D590|nr:3-deoxy-manno-octulosonate-8-phosphatase KdsC [Shewanella sp. 4t3-1-2LB]MBO1273345.1 3-deoxy-manno-octulosonate-8-phosphatase KdsC [Shewanella sp. 4t3-1-2LB]
MSRDSFYGPVSETVWQAARQIRLLICDVDGVFSDGRIYLGNHGEELKAFHTRDGYGVKALLNADIQVAVITGRQSQIVETRMMALGIPHIFQGIDNKLEPFEWLLQHYQLQPQQVAYIGDDMVDLPVMQRVGLSVCVADGHPRVRQLAHLVTSLNGGHGALRELADLLLLSQDKIDSAHGMSI